MEVPRWKIEIGLIGWMVGRDRRNSCRDAGGCLTIVHGVAARNRNYSNLIASYPSSLGQI